MHDKIVNQQGLIYNSKGTLPAVGRRDHGGVKWMWEVDHSEGMKTLSGNSGDAKSYYLLNLF